jgi:hypothetical protein
MSKTITTFLILIVSAAIVLSMSASLKRGFDNGNKTGKAVENELNQNSAIKMDMMENDESGRMDDEGNMQYDGIVSAAEVMDEILSSENGVTFYLNGVKLNTLTYQGIALMSYIKEYDGMALYSSTLPVRLEKGKDYERVYKQNEGGKVTEIKYRRE